MLLVFGGLMVAIILYREYRIVSLSNNPYEEGFRKDKQL